MAKDTAPVSDGMGEDDALEEAPVTTEDTEQTAESEDEAPDLGEALRSAYDKDHDDIKAESEKTEPDLADDQTEPETPPAAKAETDRKDETTQTQPSDDFSDEELGKMPDRTRERVQSITSRLKDTTQELESVRTEYNHLADNIRATGATPEQLEVLFSLTADLTSGDAERGRAAVNELYKVTQDWARTYGAELPEFNMLHNHADLQEKVDLGEMTREMAVELAKERNRLQGQQAFQDRDRQNREQLQAAQQEASEVSQQIQTLAAKWAAEDPDWRNKQGEIGQLANELAQQYQSGVVSAREVVQRLTSGYKLISAGFNTASRGRPKAQREPNSLRPGGSSGQGKIARGGDTMSEALRNAYDSMPGS